MYIPIRKDILISIQLVNSINTKFGVSISLNVNY